VVNQVVLVDQEVAVLVLQVQVQELMEQLILVVVLVVLDKAHQMVLLADLV
jgi:hypothetical protein